MENENVVVDNSNTTKETEPNTVENTETTVEETQEESVEEVKARLAKAEELANSYKVRAEKAEKKAKESIQVESKVGELSSKDIIAINRANIHEDDLDEVVDYAKYKKISISEALKSNVVTTLLKDRAEHRKIAQGTNTGTAKRSSVKITDEEVLNKAAQNMLPEDPELLALARWNQRKKK